jgi:hypothetical protein
MIKLGTFVQNRRSEGVQVCPIGHFGRKLPGKTGITPYPLLIYTKITTKIHLGVSMTTTTPAGSITAALAQDRPICPRCDGPAYAGLLCQACAEVCHAESFRPLIEYALAHRCPRCKAPPWVDCIAPRKASADEPTHRLHARRQDRAIWHYYRDVGHAPWPEAREPGRSYSTLPAAEPAAQPVSADIGAPTAPTVDAGESPPSG